jgi:hypothetical protein
MKWGVRRYQNKDGTLTSAGRKRYYNSDGTLTKSGEKAKSKHPEVFEKETELRENQKKEEERVQEFRAAFHESDPSQKRWIYDRDLRYCEGETSIPIDKDNKSSPITCAFDGTPKEFKNGSKQIAQLTKKYPQIKDNVKKEAVKYITEIFDEWADDDEWITTIKKNLIPTRVSYNAPYYPSEANSSKKLLTIDFSDGPQSVLGGHGVEAFIDPKTLKVVNCILY